MAKVKRTNLHYSLEEKIKILEKETALLPEDTRALATILDDFPFEDLKAISKAIAIMSKGNS